MYALYFVYNMSEHFLTDRLQEVIRSTEPNNLNLWLYGSLQFILAILFPVLCFLIISLCLQLVSRGETFKWEVFERHLTQKSSPLIIETLRSWGSILSYGILLIIPGFIRYLQLTFVPFIAALSPSYEKGEKDALQYSRQIFKKNIFLSLLVLIMFELILPLIISSMTDEYRNFSDFPMAYLGLNLVDTFLFLLTAFFLYKIFINSSQKMESTL